MNPQVVIFGANGFLGRYLARHYSRLGREVVCVARRRDGWSGDGMFLEWDGKTMGPWSLALEGADRVINLTGRNVIRCRDAKSRREILRSRLESTRIIGRAIAACRVPPALWMNAGSVEWYDESGSAQDEWKGERGKGFFQNVAQAAEEEFFAAKVPGVTRKVALRIGMVLANEDETAFRVFRRLVRRGFGGRMGSGKQRVSWIHMDDFLAAIDHIASDPCCDGLVNLVSPDSPTNAEMMRFFREQEGMPIGVPASGWMVQWGARLLGTDADFVLRSRFTDPLRLRESGFRWRWPHLDAALADLDAREGVDGFFRQPERRSAGVRVWVPGRKVAAGGR